MGLRFFLIVIAATHIALLANKNEPTPQQQPTESIIGCVADEIGKYKDLLDCGAITPEEYVRQKGLNTEIERKNVTEWCEKAVCPWRGWGAFFELCAYISVPNCPSH